MRPAGAAQSARRTQASDCVILAVLPGQAQAVLEPLAFGDKLVVSLMAGVALADVKAWTGAARVVLACPLSAPAS